MASDLIGYFVIRGMCLKYMLLSFLSSVWVSDTDPQT